jgi:hypothetical protein
MQYRQFGRTGEKVSCPGLGGGKNRTLEEFRALARSAGLEVRASSRHPSGRFIVERRPIG